MKPLLSKYALLFALLWSPSLFAASKYVARGSRVDLGVILPDASAQLQAIDLGPAAPPGSSRLFSAEAIRTAVRQAGYDPDELTLPANVRVESPARHLSPTQIAELTRPSVEHALPPGVTLKQLKAQLPLTVSPDAVVGAADLPALPRRTGLVKLAATVQLLHDGTVVERIPLTLVVEVSKQALVPDVKHGAPINLVIQRGAATVSTEGAALEDASVGSLARFRVLKTGRIVRAKLTSPLAATVTEGS